MYFYKIFSLAILSIACFLVSGSASFVQAETIVYNHLGVSSWDGFDNCDGFYCNGDTNQGAAFWFADGSYNFDQVRALMFVQNDGTPDDNDYVSGSIRMEIYSSDGSQSQGSLLYSSEEKDLSTFCIYNNGTTGNACQNYPTGYLQNFNFPGGVSLSGSDSYYFTFQLTNAQTHNVTGTANRMRVMGYCVVGATNFDQRCKGSAFKQMAMQFVAGASPIPTPFYAQIKNTSGGTLNLLSASSTSSSILKTLPEDWVVYVSSTTNQIGSSTIADGYRWYQVTDPTDNVSGWMAGQNATSSETYLPYVASKQTEFEDISSDYIATSSRPDLILEAVDHYYNNASSTYSLYSSDDGDNDISILNDRDYEKKVIWGIAAQESGGIDFDNQYVSYHNPDYGLGIMQISFVPEHWDNRGTGSRVVIPPCEAVNSSLYLNCFGGSNPKYYLSYKQYTNTEQSVYSNIKDGLKVLQTKIGNNLVCNATTSVITLGSYSYTCLDREILLSTAQYNGTSTYLGAVANRLRNIDDYFPTATTSDITPLIDKLDYASDHLIYIQLNSPGDVSVQDSKGNVVGMIEGKIKNDFQFASYDPERKSIQIFFPQDNNLTYKVTGTGTGVYGLDVTIKEGKEQVFFRSKGIPITPGQIHKYKVDKKAVLDHRNDAVTVEVDSNGDGKVDKVLKTGASLTGAEFNSKAQPVEGSIGE
jgi:hypothetical protein